MQLGPVTRPAPPHDLADGLARRAAELGQRPAVTMLARSGRAEQGFGTLAQWAAKGAHLLQTDLFLSPGDRVLVDVPPSWMLAAVCSAVWWAGGTVVVGDEADVAGAIVHEARPRPSVADVYRVGDEVDGGVAMASDELVWSEEVQAFPDQPPRAAAAPDVLALVDADGARTHAELVAALADETGVLGVDLAGFVGAGIAEVAARPLVTGRATVVVADGVGRGAASGDRVTTWA